MSLLILKFFFVWYVFFSTTLFIIYGIDKAQARADGRRIPEKVFHYLSMAGGFPGGLIGRPFFHHKTRNPVFMIILLCSMVIHIAIWVTVSIFTF
jgi:uncharacterized membrane protein YsdA (DUF1294 family)